MPRQMTSCPLYHYRLLTLLKTTRRIYSAWRPQRLAQRQPASNSMLVYPPFRSPGRQ